MPVDTRSELTRSRLSAPVAELLGTIISHKSQVVPLSQAPKVLRIPCSLKNVAQFGDETSGSSYSCATDAPECSSQRMRLLEISSLTSLIAWDPRLTSQLRGASFGEWA